MLIVVALVALLGAEARAWRPGIWVAKPLASTGLITLALERGALAQRYGQLLLTALCFCWGGDVLLILRRKGAFTAGLVSFLLGHALYLAAFCLVGVSPGAAVVAALVLVPLSLGVHRWLRPHLGSLHLPVVLYLVVITAMVVAAAASANHGEGALRLAGALAFYASDLAVARDRFVHKGVANRLWGLPLYYGGQVLLALSVGTSPIS